MFGKKNKQENLQQTQQKKLKEKKLHSWYNDKYHSVLLQRNFLMLFSILSLITMFVGFIYINLISQRKEVEPFVVEIEEKSGIPTSIDQKTKSEYTAQEAMQEFFTYKYIRAREGYDYRDYKYNYYTVVRVLSTNGVFRSFYRKINKRNEESPINKYGRNIKLVPKVKSILDITDPSEGMVSKQVRILVQHIKNNGIVAEEHKVAIIKYRFENLNLKFEERLVNPLGFQVIDYKIDHEINTN